MPKISVIVPIYGVEKYIERCVRSLFEQTLDDIEYIFVDDCSPDKSVEILKQLIEEYKMIIKEKGYSVNIKRMTKNIGLPSVRKYGIQTATGEYVIHCDSDDWVDIDMYRLMYEKAKMEGADVVSCGYIVHDGDMIIRQMKETPKFFKEEAIKQMILQQTHWTLWNKLFRRSLYKNIRKYPVENMGEDMAVSLQLMYFCDKIAHIDKCLYYYYYNRESMTNVKDETIILKHFYQAMNNCELLYEFYSTKCDFYKYKKYMKWIKYIVKRHIIIRNIHTCKMWKTTYPLIEWSVLFINTLSRRQRLSIIKSNIARIVVMIKYCKCL